MSKMTCDATKIITTTTKKTTTTMTTTTTTKMTTIKTTTKPVERAPTCDKKTTYCYNRRILSSTQIPSDECKIFLRFRLPRTSGPAEFFIVSKPGVKQIDQIYSAVVFGEKLKGFKSTFFGDASQTVLKFSPVPRITQYVIFYAIIEFEKESCNNLNQMKTIHDSFKTAQFRVKKNLSWIWLLLISNV